MILTENAAIMLTLNAGQQFLSILAWMMLPSAKCAGIGSMPVRKR
jgi:hypothetical protein